MLPGDNKINKGGFTFVTNCPFMTCRSNTNLYCNTFKFIFGIRHLAPLQLIEWGGLFMTHDLKHLRWTKNMKESYVEIAILIYQSSMINTYNIFFIEVFWNHSLGISIRRQWLVGYIQWYVICIFIKMYVTWINYYNLEARE